MATKFMSLLREQAFILLLKSAVFFGFFLMMVKGEFHFLVAATYSAAAIVLYITPAFNLSKIPWAFVTLLFLSVRSTPLLSPIFPSISLGLIFATLFYIILGIKNLQFLYRDVWYRGLYLGLSYLLLLVFFLADKSENFLGEALSISIISFLLFREALKNNTENNEIEKKKTTSIAALYVWILMQSIWVIGLLPLGFLNAGSAALVILFLTSELLTGRLTLTLTPKTILAKTTVALLLLVVIFGFSSWTM